MLCFSDLNFSVPGPTGCPEDCDLRKLRPLWNQRRAQRVHGSSMECFRKAPGRTYCSSRWSNPEISICF